MCLIYVFLKETKEVSPVVSKSIVRVCLGFSKKFAIVHKTGPDTTVKKKSLPSSLVNQEPAFVSDSRQVPVSLLVRKVCFWERDLFTCYKDQPFADQKILHPCLRVSPAPTDLPTLWMLSFSSSLSFQTCSVSTMYPKSKCDSKCVARKFSVPRWK